MQSTTYQLDLTANHILELERLAEKGLEETSETSETWGALAQLRGLACDIRAAGEPAFSIGQTVTIGSGDYKAEAEVTNVYLNEEMGWEYECKSGPHGANRAPYREADLAKASA